MCTRGHAITNLLRDNECTSLETVTSTVMDRYKCVSSETMTSYGHESHSFFKPRVHSLETVTSTVMNDSGNNVVVTTVQYVRYWQCNISYIGILSL